MSAEPIREATDAELDAKMLAELRENIEWRFPSGISITGEEGALILRIADERDALKRELCEEREGRGRRLISFTEGREGSAHVVTTCAHCPHAPHGAGFLCHDSQTCGCRGGLS